MHHCYFIYNKFYINSNNTEHLGGGGGRGWWIKNQSQKIEITIDTSIGSLSLHVSACGTCKVVYVYASKTKQ